MTTLEDIDALTNDYIDALQAGQIVDPDGVAPVVVVGLDGDLGYGIDLSCDEDITSDAAEVDPDSPEAVSQALFRRITTQHGQLKYLGEDPDYGRDVITFLSAAMTGVEIMAQQDLLAAECLKDDRVKSCKCIITYLGKDETGADAFDISIFGELYSGRAYSLTERLTNAQALTEDMAQ